jgi:hypothetical protein
LETPPAKKHGCLKIGAILAAVVIVILGVFILVYRAGAVDRGLAEASAAENKKLPGYLSVEIRVDSTSVGPGRVLHYHCTVLDWAPEFTHLSVATFAANMREEQLEKAHSSPASQGFSRNGVSLEFDYSEPDGTPITQVVLTPDDLK